MKRAKRKRKTSRLRARRRWQRHLQKMFPSMTRRTKSLSGERGGTVLLKVAHGTQGRYVSMARRPGTTGGKGCGVLTYGLHDQKVKAAVKKSSTRRRTEEAEDIDEARDVGVHGFRSSSSSTRAAPAWRRRSAPPDGLPRLLLLLFPLLDLTGDGLGRRNLNWLGFRVRHPWRLL
jgi:hypothetical protein